MVLGDAVLGQVRGVSFAPFVPVGDANESRCDQIEIQDLFGGALANRGTT